jgi:tetratricopeptide (TPR) repeat protein
MQSSSRRSQSGRPAKSVVRRNGRRNSVRGRSNSKRQAGTTKLVRSRNHGALSQTQAMPARPDPRAKAAVKLFAEATRYFYRQNFSRAKEMFEKVIDGAPSDIAARARVHVRLCEQKLSKPTPAPKTPADYYNLGVAELNARDLEMAVEHLTKADKAAPHRDEIQYALAAARSLLGNTDSALEHLKAAIALRPENRFLAQHDDDFGPLRSEPRFRTLMRPQSDSSSQYFS